MCRPPSAIRLGGAVGQGTGQDPSLRTTSTPTAHCFIANHLQFVGLLLSVSAPCVAPGVHEAGGGHLHGLVVSGALGLGAPVLGRA